MKRASTTPIRALVAEGSRAQRELLVALLSACDDFVVVGTASNGREAVAVARSLAPDVIAIDTHLPLLDGYEATRQIMQQSPAPIVLIGSRAEAAHHSGAALAAGALALIEQPRSTAGATEPSQRDTSQAAFLTTLRLMSDVRVVRRYPARSPSSAGQTLPASLPGARSPGMRSAAHVPQVLAIAASTGGPAALQLILRGLGAEVSLPILVVQHISRGFIVAFAEWLDATVPQPVRVAHQGERLLAGHVYLAPEDYHLTVCAQGIASLRPPAPDDRYCPSADYLFTEVARAYGARALGLVLTGMGDDGTRGLLAMRAAGALTLAQDAASSVVYGMPRAAVEAGAITRSEPLAGIAAAILQIMS